MEGYLVEESLTFYSRFLHNVETKSNIIDINIDGYIGSPTHTPLNKMKHEQVHRYIIFYQYIIEKCQDVILKI